MNLSPLQRKTLEQYRGFRDAPPSVGRLMALAAFSHAMLVLVAGCGSPEDVPPREGVIGLKPHQMLVVSGLPGTALVDITEYGSGRTAYRWRFRSPSSNEVLSGNGVVFEKYEKVWDPALKMTVSQDVGSQLAIRVGPGDNPIEMDWSYGSRSAAWFYYDPENLHVRILPDNLFDSSGISHLELPGTLQARNVAHCNIMRPPRV